MKGLSVIIIVKNEKDNIRNCLESVKWAQEIVVVDDWSTDSTLEICKEYTDRIYQKKLTSYGEQKQFALDKATGEWVLSIDADEIVTPELKREISAAINQKFDGFYIKRRFYFLNHLMRFGGCGREKYLRLFKRNKGRFGEGLVHEKIIVNGKIGQIKGYIIHKSYKDIFHYFEKFNRYTTLAAEQKFKQGKKATLYHFFIPLLEFFYKFFLKLGFLDGIPGFLWASFSSFYVFTKYAKLWEMQRSK
jgi:glycosyltransferase involved in cell wall biosynthesis